MGLFDDIEVLWPLPDGYKHTMFQTKDLECCMGRYRINADGTLDKAEWEPVPEPERPYPDMPFIGSVRRSGVWTKISFHGILNFYNYDKDETPDWHEYEAKFTDGKVVEIVAVIVPAEGG